MFVVYTGVDTLTSNELTDEGLFELDDIKLACLLQSLLLPCVKSTLLLICFTNLFLLLCEPP